LPYHYGGWEFIPGRGWVWFPGSFRTWSPSQVTWFHGPNWVGWIPRTRRKDGAIACGNNCGGGVVSASTFQRGGLLSSKFMLPLDPTTGERVKTPGIIPSMAAKLTGPAVSYPAAQSQGFQGNPAHAPMRAGIPNPVTTTPHVGAVTPNSTVVFDPQQDRNVNGRRVMTPQQSSASPAGAGASATPAANPGLIQPVPIGSREPSGRPAENQGFPNPTGYSFAKQGPSGPNSNPSGSRPTGSAGPAGGSHIGGGAPTGGHSGSAPAGGGHTGGGHR
jgi:hypothetical protein